MSVSKIQTFCWYDSKTLNYELTNVVRTQDIKPVYWETSAFYIFKSDILKKHDRRVGFNPYLVITDRIESLDIDDQEDYDLAKSIISNSI
jgi:CMP-N-acetylneuraminic acid synthetase